MKNVESYPHYLLGDLEGGQATQKKKRQHSIHTDGTDTRESMITK